MTITDLNSNLRVVRGPHAEVLDAWPNIDHTIGICTAGCVLLILDLYSLHRHRNGRLNMRERSTIVIAVGLDRSNLTKVFDYVSILNSLRREHLDERFVTRAPDVWDLNSVSPVALRLQHCYCRLQVVVIQPTLASNTFTDLDDALLCNLVTEHICRGRQLVVSVFSTRSKKITNRGFVHWLAGFSHFDTNSHIGVLLGFIHLRLSDVSSLLRISSYCICSAKVGRVEGVVIGRERLGDLGRGEALLLEFCNNTEERVSTLLGIRAGPPRVSPRLPEDAVVLDVVLLWNYQSCAPSFKSSTSLLNEMYLSMTSITSTGSARYSTHSSFW